MHTFGSARLLVPTTLNVTIHIWSPLSKVFKALVGKDFVACLPLAVGSKTPLNVTICSQATFKTGREK